MHLIGCSASATTRRPSPRKVKTSTVMMTDANGFVSHGKRATASVFWAEIGSTEAEFDRLGIVLDTGPRKATKTGAAVAHADAVGGSASADAVGVKPVEENPDPSPTSAIRRVGGG